MFTKTIGVGWAIVCLVVVCSPARPAQAQNAGGIALGILALGGEVALLGGGAYATVWNLRSGSDPRIESFIVSGAILGGLNIAVGGLAITSWAAFEGAALDEPILLIYGASHAILGLVGAFSALTAFQERQYYHGEGDATLGGGATIVPFVLRQTGQPTFYGIGASLRLL